MSAGAWPAVAPPGTGVKFAVVDAATGNASATWRVWAHKNNDDVFLIELKTGPRWKVSHHERDWRIAMTSEAATELDHPRVVVDSWPKAAPHKGWSEGVGVLFPCAYLRPPGAGLDAGVVQIPTSPEHSAIAVRIFFEETGAPAVRFGHAFPIAVLQRKSGGRAYVLAEPVALGGKQHRALAEMAAKARTGLPQGPGVGTDRFVGVLQMADQRVLVDLTIN